MLEAINTISYKHKHKIGNNGGMYRTIWGQVVWNKQTGHFTENIFCSLRSGYDDEQLLWSNCNGPHYLRAVALVKLQCSPLPTSSCFGQIAVVPLKFQQLLWSKCPGPFT
jgi:hypothetical protein